MLGLANPSVAALILCRRTLSTLGLAKHASEGHHEAWHVRVPPTFFFPFRLGAWLDDRPPHFPVAKGVDEEEQTLLVALC